MRLRKGCCERRFLFLFSLLLILIDISVCCLLLRLGGVVGMDDALLAGLLGKGIF